MNNENQKIETAKKFIKRYNKLIESELKTLDKRFANTGYTSELMGIINDQKLMTERKYYSFALLQLSTRMEIINYCGLKIQEINVKVGFYERSAKKMKAIDRDSCNQLLIKAIDLQSHIRFLSKVENFII